MTRGEENLILYKKRNMQIKNDFYEVYKVEKNIDKTFEILSNNYFLAPITVRQIVYAAGNYRKLKHINKGKFGNK